MKSHKKRNQKDKVSWIGTSLSKVLDKEKMERDLNIDLNISRAYCIKEEENARYKKENFKTIVPEVIEKQEPDVVILQTGSIEITNIDVNKALMDKDTRLEEYRKIWFEKVEEDSKNLFNIAQDALKNNDKLKKVIIFKRLPRFDRSSSDLLGIKAQLSNYANSVYDQLWIKMGSLSNVIILDLDLEGSRSFRHIVYGSPDTQKYDGIHTFGEGATRQFTYQAIKQLKAKVFPSADYKPAQRQYQKRQYNPVNNQSPNINSNPHPHPQSYAEAASSNTGHSNQSSSETYSYQYSVPTENMFNHLNYPNM